MKKLLLVTIFFSVNANSEFYQSVEFTKVKLLPLNEYIMKNDMRFAAENSYVLQRCIASFITASRITKDQRPELSDSYFEDSKAMLLLADRLYLISNNGKSSDTSMNVLIANIKVMNDMLAKDVQEQYAATGKYFSKENLNDLKVCSAFFADWRDNTESRIKNLKK